MWMDSGRIIRVARAPPCHPSDAQGTALPPSRKATPLDARLASTSRKFDSPMKSATNCEEGR